MARELTIKQRKFLKYVAQGMSGAAAARKAGYSEKAANEIASENLSKPNVREALLKAMEDAGITDERIAQVMKDGLDAKRVISARVIYQSGREGQANESTDDFIEVPDHLTRHKYLETAIDVTGAKAPKNVNVRNQTLEDLLTLDDGGTDSTTEDAG